MFYQTLNKSAFSRNKQAFPSSYVYHAVLSERILQQCPTKKSGLIACEPVFVERRVRRQARAISDYFKGRFKHSLKKATGQVNVTLKVEFVTFRHISYRIGINKSCEPTLCQNGRE